MTLGVCSREKEVLELLKKGQWAQACPDDLHVHVAGCRACGDLVLVTEVFQNDRAKMASLAPIPSSGPLWWRAQLRRRNSAIERLARPLLGAQIFALAVTLLAGAAFLTLQAQSGIGWLSWLRELPRAFHFEALWPAALLQLGGSLWLLVPVLATLASLGGIAVYFGSEKQ
jgi:hypothetical protein